MIQPESSSRESDAGAPITIGGAERSPSRALLVDAQRLGQCVHCGLCLPSCPTYLELGTEMDSPRGRLYLMRALQECQVGLTEPVVRHLDLCLGCRACEPACPSGVRYGALLEEARAQLADGYRRSLWQQVWRRFVMSVFPHPTRLRLFLAPVRALQALRIWPLIGRWVPGAALLPPLESQRPLPELSIVDGPERTRVGILPGCVASELFAGTNHATVRVLNKNNVTVSSPAEPLCCGALHLHNGDAEAARGFARRVIDAFPAGLDAIVVNAAGCGAMMKEYGELLGNDPTYAARAAEFAARVRDITEYLVSLPIRAPSAALCLRVAYHDACHLAHAQGIREQPRALLRLIPGIELLELRESDLCCGSAGTYNLTEPDMARRLLARKVANIVASGADCVAVANPGCSLQIQAGLRVRRTSLRVAHPVELLDEAYAAEK